MKEYETPELEVIYFETEDILTTSPPHIGEGEDDFQVMTPAIRKKILHAKKNCHTYGNRNPKVWQFFEKPQVPLPFFFEEI